MDFRLIFQNFLKNGTIYINCVFKTETKIASITSWCEGGGGGAKAALYLTFNCNAKCNVFGRNFS